MTYKRIIQIVPWVLLLLALSYIGQCTRNEPETVTEYRDSLRVDTIERTITKYQQLRAPEPDTVIQTFTVYKIDSAECQRLAAAYFSTAIYNRHIVVDSIGWIDLRDSVHQNRLTGYAVDYKFTERTIIKDRTIYPPERGMLSGGLILSGGNEYFGAAPVVMFTTKKKTHYIAGYDVINGNFVFGVGLRLF